MNAQPIVGFGELLWDLLPAGRMAGGAPFNFTFHCHQLGHPSVMVSRVGADSLGQDLRGLVRDNGLSDEFLQEDALHPTGVVHVNVDSSGQPDYEIVREVAWDYIAWQPGLEKLARECAAVCFGSLCQRSVESRQTLKKFLSHCSKKAIRIFDVNLRQSYFTREILDDSLWISNWVKLNHDELEILDDLLGLRGGDVEESVEVLRRRYQLDLVAITMGEDGCLVHAGNERIYQRGHRIQVEDTIGAGDAFTAGMVVGILKGKSVQDSCASANLLASKVASAAGGIPRLGRDEIEAILR